VGARKSTQHIKAYGLGFVYTRYQRDYILF